MDARDPFASGLRPLRVVEEAGVSDHGLHGGAQFMKQALRELTSQCGTWEDCPVIDSMSGKAAPPAKSPYHGCCGLTSSLRNV